MHHIVDPRSGAPAAEVWRTVSVAAADCVEANAASTAAIVRGEGAVAWLERAGLPARLVRGDGTIGHDRRLARRGRCVTHSGRLVPDARERRRLAAAADRS